LIHKENLDYRNGKPYHPKLFVTQVLRYLYDPHTFFWLLLLQNYISLHSTSGRRDGFLSTAANDEAAVFGCFEP
jgi:hypothetical protein